MKLNKLNNQKIAILGLGLENLALIKYLLQHKVKCEITVCDKRKEARKKISYKNIHWQLGAEYNKNLEKFDRLFRSPGWPIACPGIQKALKTGIKLSGPMELFFELCPTKNIIGVTGTKGKGTTASLIYEILKAAGKKVWLAGNIGVAPLSFIDKIKKTDWVVLELSSFQLEDLKASPHISVLTNLYPEHLKPADPYNPNFHKNFKAYRNAKMNIMKWQQKIDKAILNYELKIINHGLKSQVYTFSGKNCLADCFWADANKIKFRNSSFKIYTSLLGEHNKENIAAAAAAAKIAGVKNNIIKKAVANFKGLEHRIELAGKIGGVEYYDDSFATTPESTIIALKAFAQAEKQIILLLGGADKGSNFKKLAREIKKRTKAAVLLDGAATPRIRKELSLVGFKNVKLAQSMKQAVKIAEGQARASDIVLLSAACASFGMFRNYKERGRLFKQEVGLLK